MNQSIRKKIQNGVIKTFINGEEIEGSVGGGNPIYDLGPFGFSSMPSSNESDWILITRQLIILAGNSGSAYAKVAPAQDIVFLISVDDVEIGTASFGEGQNSGTIIIENDTSVLPGQKIFLVAPPITDNSIENIQVVLNATIV